MKKYITIISIILFTTPFITHAALFNNLTGLINILIDLINKSTVIVVALALLFFFWGMSNFIFNAADETKRKEGRSVMMWGVIVLFVIVSIAGIINVLNATFLKGNNSSTNSRLLPSLSPSGLNQFSPKSDSFNGPLPSLSPNDLNQALPRSGSSDNSPFDFTPPSSSDLLNSKPDVMDAYGGNPGGGGY